MIHLKAGTRTQTHEGVGIDWLQYVHVECIPSGAVADSVRNPPATGPPEISPTFPYLYHHDKNRR
jgi:hypothetical protein